MAAQLPNNHPLHLGFESARQSKVPERQRSDRIAWQEDSVDDERLRSIYGSSAQKTCGVESAYRRRVSTATQQPNFSCRSIGLESLAFRHFALVTFICASK
jgi:hypothetical protein